MNLNSLGFNENPKNIRIVVAMSGGVDSSVAAGILKKEGYNVIGITLYLHNLTETENYAKSCCAEKDIEDARKVCDILNIPHYVLNYEKSFHKKVINPFLDSYLHGETPIPCVLCNQNIKFVDLLKTSKNLGAHALVTGHYVRSIRNESNYFLYRPLDLSRDQTYFLFSVNQEQINYLRFPLGGLLKKEVRHLAKSMGLSVSDKNDSQDICFIAKNHYSKLISNRLESNHSIQEGDIVHVDGNVLGRHNGIFNFTIGQRRGIGVSIGKPLYVIHIDVKNFRIIVGPKDLLKIERIYLKNVNWLDSYRCFNNSETGINIAAKIRSQMIPSPAILYYNCKEFWIDFPLGANSVSPGQACVFYDSESSNARLLGGGIISRSDLPKKINHFLKKFS